LEPDVTLVLGPVLYFRGAFDRSWRLSALVATRSDDEPLPLDSGADRVPPRLLAVRCERRLWRYDFSLPRAATSASLEYRIGGESWRVHVPGLGGAVRMAYSACNGSEKVRAWDHLEERNERWLHLAAKHADNPFHVLLQGGDQLYADPLWEEVPALARWKKLPWRRRLRAPFPAETAEAVADHYFSYYLGLWGQPQLAPVLATIPSLMMWDDHDIFDGWGSWSAKWQECPTFRGIWAAARENFALFQLASLPDDLPEGFSDRRGGHFAFAYRIGEIGILAPDLRSERSRERVMGEAGWRAFRALLESMADCQEVLLLLSMPLVTPRLGALERFFDLVPGHQTWQDDLVDQWPSNAHWDEWRRFLHELTRFSARTGARITSLSGEIHLGALGLIESGRTRIYQLTSSGIAHPPPPAWIVRGLEWISSGTLRPADDLKVELLPLPGLGRRFLRRRNWLELDLPPQEAPIATWHGEGGVTSRLTLAAAGAASPCAGAPAESTNQQ
jgi:PhoD related phosphatase